MSRWFPDTLHLLLGGSEPAPAAAGVLGGAQTAQESDRSGTGTATPRTSRLERQLTAFAAQLDATAPAPGTRLVCWLGSDVARLLVVPWQDGLTRASQRALLAQHCFREVFGSTAGGWQRRLSETGYGRPALAGAVDGWVLERIDELARVRKLKLASVQPLLMTAYNRALPELRARGDVWFVLSEPPWLTLLLVQAGAPLAVKLVHAGDAELGRLLEREWRTLGREGPRCEVLMVRCGTQRDAAPGASLARDLSDFGFKLTALDPLIDDSVTDTMANAAAPSAPPLQALKVVA